MNERKIRNISKIQLVLFTVVIFITLIVLSLYIILIYRNNRSEDEARAYTGHYSFVVDDLSDEFLDAVYDSICSEAAEKGIYVEKVGVGLSGKYTLAQKLEMAIATEPQGIIIKADDSKDIKLLINKAVSEGIPVSTIITDITGSERSSFIGPNYYDLGKVYGEELKRIPYGKKYDVALLMNNSMPESNRNSLFQGLYETLNSDKKHYDVSIIDIDYTDNLTIEEGIRNAILNDEADYDAFVATDQLMTAYTYQALLDYNKIGEVDVLGFYDTETILNGVKNGNLQAVISIEPKQVGKLVTDSLSDYREYGYSNYFMPVSFDTITAKNIDEYLTSNKEKGEK